ncbi:hypothetical protein [Methanocella arvoryzae]|uniref:Uncharacterized protein n=1 Tax=Methanocella arvoryzae (strain DSM 22066 / NBRC 105507 / MRE50) TaxID=351160 RepID=Q0W1C3_METAR|nr:hypothetical protein [Methanocella arvoryzae]CAJ37820.1 hypothetical protein RRC35 [Methanocella arvoryzae MRE50]
MTEQAGLIGLSGDVIRPYGELDVLPYYGRIAEKLTGFLHGRELASRIWTPHGRIRSVVVTGQTAPPLYIRQMSEAVTPQIIRAREQYSNLDEVRGRLSPEQQLVWQYFPQRRYIGFYYSLNRIGPAREIDRVVFQIERSFGSTLAEALEAAQEFIRAAVSDTGYQELFRREPFVYWTGSSFQVMLFTREVQPATFYRSHLECTGKGRTMADLWTDLATASTGSKIVGGTGRRKGAVLINSEPTLPGKLCPVPLGCLDMADGTTLRGVSVPLTGDMLSSDILDDLTAYTPERIVEELDKLAARLPV